MKTILLVRGKRIKNWWVSLLLGLLYIALGIWILNTPLKSFVSLSLLFSIFIIASGLFWTIFAFSIAKDLSGWGWFLAGGLLELLIGMLLIFYPAITLTILALFIGFWLLLVGIIGIGNALHYKSFGGKNWGWPLAFGIATVVFSLLLLANPIFAGISIVFMTSFSLISWGVFRIIFAFNLRKIHKTRGTWE